MNSSCLFFFSLLWRSWSEKAWWITAEKDERGAAHRSCKRDAIQLRFDPSANEGICASIVSECFASCVFLSATWRCLLSVNKQISPLFYLRSQATLPVMRVEIRHPQPNLRMLTPHFCFAKWLVAKQNYVKQLWRSQGTWKGRIGICPIQLTHEVKPITFSALIWRNWGEAQLLRASTSFSS